MISRPRRRITGGLTVCGSPQGWNIVCSLYRVLQIVSHQLLFSQRSNLDRGAHHSCPVAVGKAFFSCTRENVHTYPRPPCHDVHATL